MNTEDKWKCDLAKSCFDTNIVLGFLRSASFGIVYSFKKFTTSFLCSNKQIKYKPPTWSDNDLVEKCARSLLKKRLKLSTSLFSCNVNTRQVMGHTMWYTIVLCPRHQSAVQQLVSQCTWSKHSKYRKYIYSYIHHIFSASQAVSEL